MGGISLIGLSESGVHGHLISGPTEHVTVHMDLDGHPYDMEYLTIEVKLSG